MKFLKIKMTMRIGMEHLRQKACITESLVWHLELGRGSRTLFGARIAPHYEVYKVA